MTPFEFQKIISKLSVEEISNIKDIGPVVAQSIYGWFRDSKNQELIKELNEAGIELEKLELEAAKQPFSGLTFVLTGELKNFSRERAKEKIRELGGNAGSSISKNTNYVIIGENPGSKYDKAKKLGVKILNEQKFLKLIK